MNKYPELTKRPTRLRFILGVLMETLGGIVAVAVLGSAAYIISVILDGAP